MNWACCLLWESKGHTHTWQCSRFTPDGLRGEGAYRMLEIEPRLADFKEAPYQVYYHSGPILSSFILFLLFDLCGGYTWVCSEIFKSYIHLGATCVLLPASSSWKKPCDSRFSPGSPAGKTCIAVISLVLTLSFSPSFLYSFLFILPSFLSFLLLTFFSLPRAFLYKRTLLSYLDICYGDSHLTVLYSPPCSCFSSLLFLPGFCLFPLFLYWIFISCQNIFYSGSTMKGLMGDHSISREHTCCSEASCQACSWVGQTFVYSWGEDHGE